MTDHATRCPSCGRPWTEHMGAVGLCARVEALEHRIAQARAALLLIWPDGAGCHHTHAATAFRALDLENLA